MPRTHDMQRSESDSTAPAGDNTLYQRRLAESLIASMEPHEAIDLCQENGWEGVLQVVLTLQRSADRAQ
ncbi:MAG: hypothetical protein BMS9Abin01_2049 [Gammaproteobacteria bacterium]|nr:MAG: hypothetical protein BMS9Abin01_2049 [Gammaproteobacteria bacterium]